MPDLVQLYHRISTALIVAADAFPLIESDFTANCVHCLEIRPRFGHRSGSYYRRDDRRTGLLRSPGCDPADAVLEWYVAGTEPVLECDASAVQQLVKDSIEAASFGRQPDPAKAARARPAAPTPPR